MSGPPPFGVQLLIGRRVAARSPAPRGCRPRSSYVRRIPGRRGGHHNTQVEWKAASDIWYISATEMGRAFRVGLIAGHVLIAILVVRQVAGASAGAAFQMSSDIARYRLV